VKRKTPPRPSSPSPTTSRGFEKVARSGRVFGDETEAVLARLKIGFISNKQMYMGIRDVDGNLAVGTYHLRHSPTRVLYLDIVHELFHIKQWMTDKSGSPGTREVHGGLFAVLLQPHRGPRVQTRREGGGALGMTRAEIVE